MDIRCQPPSFIDQSGDMVNMLMAIVTSQNIADAFFRSRLNFFLGSGLIFFLNLHLDGGFKIWPIRQTDFYSSHSTTVAQLNMIYSMKHMIYSMKHMIGSIKHIIGSIKLLTGSIKHMTGSIKHDLT